MSKWTIIHCSNQKGEFLHEEHLKKTNPNAQILKLETTNELQPYVGWKQCDIIVRRWMKENHNQIKYNNVALLEFDVLLNMELPDINLENTIIGKHSVNPINHPEWWPFSDKKRLDHLEEYAHGLLYFGFYMMSRNCIDHLIKKEYDFLFEYERDMLCELRFATVLNHSKVSIKEAENSLLDNFLCGGIGFEVKDIEYNIDIPGIYHPVKNPI